MNEQNSPQIEFAHPPDWSQVDPLVVTSQFSIDQAGNAYCNTTAGELIFELREFGLRIRTAQQRDTDYGLVCDDSALGNPSISLQQHENETTLVGVNYLVKIDHKPFSIEIFDRHRKPVLSTVTDGHFVRRFRVPPLARVPQGWLISIALKSGEPIYGGGEKWGALNKRGQFLRSYNSDALGVNAELSYKNTPFLWSPRGWGCLAHTPSPVTHAVGYVPWSQRTYSIVVEDPCLDLFLFLESESSNTGASLLQRYTSLTGRAPVPPRWSAGVILSKAYYRDADELISVAQEVRKRKMPCDVITLDGRAWQDTKTRFAFEWCKQRYPDPEKVMAQLKALNFKVCVWEYPLVSIHHPWFQEFARKGWLLKDKRTGQAYEYHWDQQAFGDVLTPLPVSGIVDFTHPEAYKFWRDAHKPLFDLGVDMIKADFGEQIEDENILAYNGENGTALHNVYAYLYNQCVYQAAELYAPSGAFLFSRSSWTGCQRFNSQWGGDPQADWEGMISNLRGGLSWGLSGAPFYATDVGGFYKDTRDDELYVRWAQAAIFSAHFRLHGIGSREPWSYSKQAERAVTNVLHLRYRLQVYLEHTFSEAHETGMPVQRAMVLAFPDEPQAWAFENQFMFGSDLLVVPCFSPAGEVEYYLPHGEWVRFDPQQTLPTKAFGGRVYKEHLQLDQMAIFVPAGVQIPLCEAVQYSDQFDEEIKVTEWWPK